MKESLAVIASILAIIGNVPYFIDVLKEKIQPHPYTWFVWSLVSCVVFFGQLSKGAGIGAMPTAFAEVFTILIFLFSIKNGFKDIHTSDHIFLVSALLGLIPWFLSKDPTLSVIIVVAIDVIAFIPTLRKTFLKPETENPILFITNVLRHSLTILSLYSYNIATTLHSITMIITNALMTVFILRKGKRRK